MKKNKEYQNNYLNRVLFKINFSTIGILLENNNDIVENFRKNIFKNFSDVNIQEKNKVTGKLNLKYEENSQINQDSICIWTFKNKNQTKIIELTSKYLQVTYKKESYEGFMNFLNDINLILNILKEHFYITPDLIELRYIIQICKKNLQELEEYITEAYYNSKIFDLTGKENLVQNISRLTINKNEYLLNFKYGLFNPLYPNPEFNKDFILDFDCIYYNIERVENVNNKLKSMNEFILEQLQNVITPKLNKEMGGIIDEEI